MKKIITIAILSAAILFAHSQSFDFHAEPKENEYIQYIESRNQGPATHMFILCLEYGIADTAIDKNDFTVKQYLVSKNDSGRTYGPSMGTLALKDAFICDKDGTPTTGRGKLIALVVDPDSEENIDPFISFKKPSGADDLYGYRIENEKLEINIATRTAVKSKGLEKFIPYEFKGTEENMKYTLFVPGSSKDSAEKIPLMVWFHGLGEGGTFVYEPLLGNPVPNLAGEKIQSHFPKGAAVLVPQCRTSWLESTTTDSNGGHKWVIVDDIKIKKSIKEKVLSPFSHISSPGPKRGTKESTENTVSLFTVTIKELLDDVLKNNSAIDPKRIYLMGCSAGGYMALNMQFSYPDTFAAVAVTCPAYPVSKISYSKVESIYDRPMWIVYAKNDETLDPMKFSAGIISRMENSGATDFHKSVFENVIISEADGKIEREHSGHSSWLYLLNDRCSDGSLNLFDWLAQKKLD